MSLTSFLVVSAVIFAVGLFGVLSRRNVITMFMSLELMFNAVNLALVAFSRYIATAPVLAGATGEGALRSLLTGQVFAVFIITVAAAEVALGLAIAIALYRVRETVDVAEATALRG